MLYADLMCVRLGHSTRSIIVKMNFDEARDETFPPDAPLVSGGYLRYP
jgi:hypothetical protein